MCDIFPDLVHPALLDHAAPASGVRWSTTKAHTVMQMHRDCIHMGCPAKRFAKKLLVDSGLLVPADAAHIGS